MLEGAGVAVDVVASRGATSSARKSPGIAATRIVRVTSEARNGADQSKRVPSQSDDSFRRSDAVKRTIHSPSVYCSSVYQPPVPCIVDDAAKCRDPRGS